MKREEIKCREKVELDKKIFFAGNYSAIIVNHPKGWDTKPRAFCSKVGGSRLPKESKNK